MTKASDNVYPRLLISEGGSTTTPASGNVTVYAKADGLLYSKDDAGAETALGGGAGGITVADEGTPLATTGTTLDFVGSGVVASGTGATKTITIAGGGGGLAQSFVGYNTVGGTWETMTTNRQYMKKITLAAASTLTSVDAYLRANTDNFGAVAAVVLADAAGVPDLLLGTTSGYNVLISTAGSGGPWAGRWLSIPMGVHLAAGDYWIGFSGQSFYDIAKDGSGTDVYQTNTGGYVSGSHAGIGKTTTTDKYSIRASILS